MRGDIHRLRASSGARGSEQRGSRYAVIVQSDDLMLSTVLVAPTSRSAPPRIFRPTITVNDEQTQVLIEQTSASYRGTKQGARLQIGARDISTGEPSADHCIPGEVHAASERDQRMKRLAVGDRIVPPH